MKIFTISILPVICLAITSIANDESKAEMTIAFCDAIKSDSLKEVSDTRQVCDALRSAQNNKNIETYLEVFIQTLRDFVNVFEFDYLHFESLENKLRNSLSDAEYVAETELDYTTLANRLIFARYVFQTMAHAKDKLKRYNRFESPQNNLVHAMVEIRVRALSMYDSHGVLAEKNDMGASSILELDQSLNAKILEFGQLKNVPPGVRVVFEIYSSQVRNTLEDLKQQLPGGYSEKSS
ncbi:hypothetical protein METSCH_C04350 [Metschnikowia aff. pulcherrima]|uniref:Uncharacterized protein n=1 Tax=Metschnikowia aff. pulcherrima TaxID=2163413 RepID=A0A4P6XM87_9ASCO|nr:hypothetical protein METSCH_C04350 [Metschnikowia aff. pulcherrima]